MPYKVRFYFYLLALVGGCLIIGLIILLTHPFKSSAQTNNQLCTSAGIHHQVNITNSQVIPYQTTANLCDTLTITNQDNQTRLIAFGPHEHHVAYDAVLEEVVPQGHSLTVTLIQAGTFQFHDHLDDSARGIFTVSR